MLPFKNTVPRFPKKTHPSQTRELLGHLAGIRHYKSDPQADLETNNTKHFQNPIQGGIDFFKNDPLVAKPGTEFHYSTQGFTLVGCVIEGASGDNYVDYVRKNVLTPAGMSHTVADDRFAIVPFRTRFYSKDSSGAITNAEFLDSSYKIPGGGWLSSADDMAQFEVAMFNDRIVNRATRELMWTPLKPSDGKEDSYALGWSTKNEFASSSSAITERSREPAPHSRLFRRVVLELWSLSISITTMTASELADEVLKIVLAQVPAK